MMMSNNKAHKVALEWKYSPPYDIQSLKFISITTFIRLFMAVGTVAVEQTFH